MKSLLQAYLFPDFLLFCVLLMIAITITDVKMRPPIFLQGWAGRSFRARLRAREREENNVPTINHIFSCIAPGSRDDLRHSLILPGHARKTLDLLLLLPSLCF